MRDAISAAQRCQTLNPSHARAHRSLATHIFLAQPQPTLQWVDRGMRLGPRQPQVAAFLLFRSGAWLVLQHGDQTLT